MHAMQREGELCDLTLVVEDSSFSVHSVVFASQSHFVRTCLASSFAEAASSTITFPDVWAAEFAAVVEFLYGATPLVRVRQLPELLEIARRLGIGRLTAVVENELFRSIRTETCVELLHIADDHGCALLRKVVVAYAAEHFDDVSKSTGVRWLSATQLSELLSCKHLKCEREDDVLLALEAWVCSQDTPPTQEVERELLSRVRLERSQLVRRNAPAAVAESQERPQNARTPRRRPRTR